MSNSDLYIESDEQFNKLLDNPEFDELHVEYIKETVRNLRRYIDNALTVKSIEPFTSISMDCGVEQVLMGDQMLYTGIFGDSEAVLKVASVYGQESFTQVDADSLDATSEFLNMNNGIYVSARSDDGIEIELDPPMMYPTNQNFVADGGEAYNVIIDIDGHDLSVLLSVDVDVFVE